MVQTPLLNKNTFRYELANSISHGIGLLFGLISVPILIVTAVYHGTAAQITGTIAFGIAFLMVYTCSTLYHSFFNPAIKKLLQKLDHISIYYLIAGSYTPFILAYVQNLKGFALLAILWFLALAGTVFKIFFTGKFELLSVLIYLLMGWIFIVLAKSFFTAFPVDCLTMVVAGGISYTVGVFFYKWEKLPYHHAIWHIFVLGGSICHYIAVYMTLSS